MAILLGIDTGGTFTDAVLYDESHGVVGKAKALTTHENLTLGIGSALEGALTGSKIDPGAISLACLSTTLATNAMVEGQGGRIALVFIGFDEADAKRADLRRALGSDPLLAIAGGHDALGQEKEPLDITGLREAVKPLAAELTGFAVTGRFAVLNPAHEIAIRDVLRRETELPVTCGHELSANLDGPKRALTCILNARLIHVIETLILSTQDQLKALGIRAPLMMVRGDGSLMAAGLARARPIETIFSGPAASALGGAFLAKTKDAIIADIGGTTTDVVILREGRPRIDPAGAIIGGLRTMVEATAIHTCGLGGDSEVKLSPPGAASRLDLGPRRCVPIALLAAHHPALVHTNLERQEKADRASDLDGCFAILIGRPLAPSSPLEDSLLDKLAGGPLALDRLVTGRRALAALNRAVARRWIILSAFTPSDAAHALGLHTAWDRTAASRAAALFARRRDLAGQPMAPDGLSLAKAVIEALIDRSADFVLDCAFAEDGLMESGLSRHPLISAAKEGRRGLVQLSLSLNAPLVGLGASASTYYPEIAARLNAPSLVPDHADVANAVGAVVGAVHMSATMTILQPTPGVFRILGGDVSEDRNDLIEALSMAERMAAQSARIAALAAGAETVDIQLSISKKTVPVGDQALFVEARVTAAASGRPRHAASIKLVAQGAGPV